MIKKFSKNKEIPYISILMVDGSFRENFHAVDFFCQQSLRREAYELIWVEFYSQVKSELREKISKYSNARILTLNRSGIYHSSYCFNAGINASRGEVIFIPDADVVVEKKFLEQAYKDHKENDKLVTYYYRFDESQEEHKSEISIDHLKKVCRLVNPGNYGPCLSVRKNWLIEVNGYEQHPVMCTGFHANGLEMYSRLKNKGLHIRWHPDLKLYHPWHPFSVVGSPLYKVQRILIDYKLQNLIKTTFFGIDPSKNVELPPVLISRLEEVKKKYKLDEAYDSWQKLKIDPGGPQDELFAWLSFGNKQT